MVRPRVTERSERLIAQHESMVYRRAHSILRDTEEARDVTQDVMWKLVAAGDTLRDDASSWLFRVTTNESLKRLRARRRQQAWVECSARWTCLSTTPELDVSCVVRKLLESADARSARAVIGVHVADMSYGEVAAELGVSRRTVGYMLERWRIWAEQQLAEPPGRL